MSHRKFNGLAGVADRKYGRYMITEEDDVVVKGNIFAKQNIQSVCPRDTANNRPSNRISQASNRKSR